MLAWDRARLSSDRSENRCRRLASNEARVSSLNEMAKPAVSDGHWPLPDFPDPRAAIGREKDDLCLADEILERNIADVDPAVGGIVAVVAHHEVMAFGYDEDLSVVEIALGIAVEHVVGHAIGQRFAITRDVAGLLPNGLDIILDLFLRHRLVVDIEHAVLHLDAVA